MSTLNHKLYKLIHLYKNHQSRISKPNLKCRSNIQVYRLSIYYFKSYLHIYHWHIQCSLQLKFHIQSNCCYNYHRHYLNNKFQLHMYYMQFNLIHSQQHKIHKKSQLSKSNKVKHIFCMCCHLSSILIDKFSNQISKLNKLSIQFSSLCNFHSILFDLINRLCNYYFREHGWNHKLGIQYHFPHKLCKDQYRIGRYYHFI